MCNRIGGSKRAISDRRPNRAFLRSRESAFSIPVFSIEQSDPRIRSKKTTFSTGCTDRIARSKEYLKPTPHLSPPQKTHDHTLQQLRCWLDCNWCCYSSQRVSVAHPVLRPPAPRTIIRWQQCMLSITFFQHRCGCGARFGDSQRVPTP